jgi:hypothetical protein
VTTTLNNNRTLSAKMLRPGIFRHYAPPVESVDLDGEVLVWRIISSSFSAFSIEMIGAIAVVANNLRSRYPNAVYPAA